MCWKHVCLGFVRRPSSFFFLENTIRSHRTLAIVYPWPNFGGRCLALVARAKAPACNPSCMIDCSPLTAKRVRNVREKSSRSHPYRRWKPSGCGATEVVVCPSHTTPEPLTRYCGAIRHRCRPGFGHRTVVMLQYGRVEDSFGEDTVSTNSATVTAYPVPIPSQSLMAILRSIMEDRPSAEALAKTTINCC